MVEYKLPKLGVAGSNPVARSIFFGFGLHLLISLDNSYTVI